MRGTIRQCGVLLWSAGIGAAFMYMMDPEKGYSRRARLRDQLARARNEASTNAGKFSRDFRDNCVSPGPVWTPLNPSDRPAEKVAELGSGQPYQRPAQPEEIAPAFVFFASEADSSYISGEVLTLLGGETTAA